MKRINIPLLHQGWWRGPLLLLGAILALSGWASLSNGDMAVLLSSYYRYVLSQQVASQSQNLTAQAPADCQPAIKEAIQGWGTDTQRRIREDLQRQFGPQARNQFEKFVADYVNAEGHGDAAYLGSLTTAVGLPPTTANYVDLRRGTCQSLLKPEVDNASRLLSEIQTWTDLKRRRTDIPSLSAWLHRGEKPLPAQPAAAPTLATAEAVSTVAVDPDDKVSSSLDSFASLRKARREKAQQQAQLGMQQVATEREAAEQEYGAKKLAAAQAEAENIKRHAEQLAQAEKDALDQDANSWSMKIKTMLATTISAGVGAFTGTIGAQAATKAADHIFHPPDTSK